MLDSIFLKWTMVYLLETVPTLLVFVLVRYTINVHKELMV